MSARGNLRVVPETAEPKDVTMLLRAEIQARDWSRVHIEADKREPVTLGERVRRIWRR